MGTPCRYSILLLQNNRPDAELEIDRLRAAGLDLDFTIAGDRDAFEAALNSNTFDLVLADHKMSNLDGLSALSIVRGRNERLPFIFVSRSPDENAELEALQKGANDFVSMERIDRLAPAVQRALNEHEEYRRREGAESELKSLQESARANAERHGLLLRLLQSQRTSLSAEEWMLEASHEIGEYMHATRAGFYEVQKDGSLQFMWQWASDRQPMSGTMPITTLDASRIEQYRRGEVAVIPDIQAIQNTNTEILLNAGIRAMIGAPILRSGTWRAGFFVSQTSPREWTQEEALFIREVAEVAWDALERARALSALEVSEQRLRTAAETANLGSWDLDLATGRMICSNQCKRNYGRPIDEDFNYPDLRASIHRDDLAMVAEAVDQALSSHTTYRAEYRNVWPDGSIHWVIASGQARYNDAGAPVRMTGFTLDVTERHKTQAALLQSEKLAAVGRLASSIAHEINNPLESVTNLLYLASITEDVSVVKEFLKQADLELRRVSGITNQTLRFHRQTGQAKPASVKELFDGVVGIFQRRLENSRIQVGVRLRATGLVECLDGEIRQVLTNLVSNSMDAMQHGGKLTLRSRNAFRDGVPGVWFTIADNGTGMTAKVKERLFEPFFTTKDIHGIGLGMWVSRQIVDRHHGKLIFRSSLDPVRRGTVFSLFLPCEAQIAI